MAKTTSQVAVTQGAGVNLSTFDLASGRRRQTVIIGDADSAGEELLAEFPAHDSADRGSPLKIGGRSLSVPVAVAENDRTDAWFTPYGELGVISMRQPTLVWDGGRRDVETTSPLLVLNGNTSTVLNATPGVKTKILRVTVFATAFTTAGIVYLSGGASNFNAGYMTAVGINLTIGSEGYKLYETAINTALMGGYTGSGSIVFAVTYYQAP